MFGDCSRRLNNGRDEVFYLDESDSADLHRRTPKVFHLANGPIGRFVLGFGEDRRAASSTRPPGAVRYVEASFRPCQGS